MFLSKSKVGICSKFRFLLLPFVVLTSQVPFNFEKIILEKNNTKCEFTEFIYAFYC